MTTANQDKIYRTYGLSLWRWVAQDLQDMRPDIQDRVDAELCHVLESAGLREALKGETPDCLLRYEIARGSLVAELIDQETNYKIWKTHLRGDDLMDEESPTPSHLLN